MYAVYSSLDTDEAIMLLNQPIGPDAENPNAAYIDGPEFERELFDLDQRGYKAIQIHINCPGGNVVQGFSMCNAVNRTKTPVDTYNVGIAASMAAVLFMTGRKRVMADYSSMMVHAPFGGTDNKMLSALRDGCVKILAGKCTGLTEEEVGALVDKETWLSPAECLAKGFATEIHYTSEANIKRMPKVTAMAMWKEAELIQSNFLKNTNMSDVNNATSKSDLSMIASFLGLNVEASMNSVFSELKTRISTLQMAKSEVEDEVKSMKKQLAKMKADADEFEDKLKAKEKEVADAKAVVVDMVAAAKIETEKKDKEIKDAADASKKVKATAEITAYATAGRIKTEAVAAYVDLAMKTSVEEVKAAIELTPLNKAATSTATRVETNQQSSVTDTAIDPHEIPANAMEFMAKVKAGVNAKLATK